MHPAGAVSTHNEAASMTAPETLKLAAKLALFSDHSSGPASALTRARLETL